MDEEVTNSEIVQHQDQGQDHDQDQDHDQAHTQAEEVIQEETIADHIHTERVAAEEIEIESTEIVDLQVSHQEVDPDLIKVKEKKEAKAGATVEVRAVVAQEKVQSVKTDQSLGLILTQDLIQDHQLL